MMLLHVRTSWFSLVDRRIWQLELMYPPTKANLSTANNRCLPGWLGCHSKHFIRKLKDWDSAIGSKHSNHRNIWAVFMPLVAFRDHVTRKTIQDMSDSISTITYLNHTGGPSSELIQMQYKQRYKKSHSHYLFSHSIR